MKKIYLLVVGLILIGGLYMSLQYGNQESTETVVPVAEYSTAQVFGEALSDSLAPMTPATGAVLLGVHQDSEKDMKIWANFLSKVQKSVTPFSQILIDPHLNFKNIIQDALPEHQVMDFDLKEQMNQFAEGVRGIVEKNQRIVLIVPSIYSSQLIKMNPVDLLKTQGINITSFSLVSFPLTRFEEDKVSYQCIVERDVEGTGPLGCAILTKARTLYRRNLQSKKNPVGLVEKMGPGDFLVFFQTPEVHN